VLFSGQLLAYTAMEHGLQVTWIPSYGPEMRGGTANCAVNISDEEIGSPMIYRPEAVICFNLPSLDKYEPLVRSGGLLVVNASLVNREVGRKDIRVVMVPASEVAEQIGDRRLTNMVMLGSLLANLKVLPLEALERAVAEHTSERHKKLVPMNIEALRRGASFAARERG
jgi:2-oxoglutarate ferredoxin oxidoreductase subunit gamma